MECIICKKAETVKFLDNYKLEIKEDKKFFNNLKIYQCEDCDFSFVNPIPSEDKLNYFYKYIYRSLNRPPYWMTENYEDIKKQYLEDKNINYLLYLTTLVDLLKIKNLYDFGSGRCLVSSNSASWIILGSIFSSWFYYFFQTFYQFISIKILYSFFRIKDFVC